jgi:ribosomal protein S12 methylthiotransferase accessory factor
VPKRVYKACDPLETIARLRHILHDLSIVPVVVDWQEVSSQCYSTRVVACDLPPMFNAGGFGSNGKGLTHAFALASAYGELLERLQNNYLLVKENDYGLVTANGRFFPDETRVSYTRLMEEQPDVMGSLICGDLPEGTREDLDRDGILCVPFYNVFEDRIERLPVELIQQACLSNGMCAGNTPEEALSHGLSEIAERMAIAHAFGREAPELPTIPREIVDTLTIGEHIRAIEAGAGVVLRFKDASLGGRYPVVACIVTDEDRSRCHIHYGADPLLETAIERSVTETFQGRTPTERLAARSPLTFDFRSHLSAHADPLGVEQFMAMRSGEAEVHDSLLFDVGHSRHADAFMSDFRSLPDSLAFAVDCFRRDGKKLYVRDVSFLGFPSYHAYCPGASEVLRLNKGRPLHSPSESRLIRSVLLRLKSSSAGDVLAAARLIERSLDFAYHHPRTGERPFRLSVMLSSSSDFITEFVDDPSWGGKLLALMALKGGDHEMAARNYSRYVTACQRRDGAGSRELCRLAHLKLRAGNVGEDERRRRLASFFEAADVDEVARDLSDDDPFRDLALPECGDCSSCPVAGECACPQWKRVDASLRERARQNPIDQTQLRSLFHYPSRRLTGEA